MQQFGIWVRNPMELFAWYWSGPSSMLDQQIGTAWMRRWWRLKTPRVLALGTQMQSRVLGCCNYAPYDVMELVSFALICASPSFQCWLIGTGESLQALDVGIGTVKYRLINIADIFVQRRGYSTDKIQRLRRSASDLGQKPEFMPRWLWWRSSSEAMAMYPDMQMGLMLHAISWGIAPYSDPRFTMESSAMVLSLLFIQKGPINFCMTRHGSSIVLVQWSYIPPSDRPINGYDNDHLAKGWIVHSICS